MEFHANDEHVYLTNERGELLANADFRETAPGVFDIYHTVGAARSWARLETRGENRGRDSPARRQSRGDVYVC